MNYNESLAKIESDFKKKEAIKTRIKQLEELTMKDLNDEEIEVIEAEIENLKNQIGQKESKKVDDLINQFEKFNLNQKKLEEIRVEYLSDNNLIVKNEVTMIAAKPSSGKSLTTLALANMALQANTIDYVFYFDLDNSLTTLKERNVGILRDKWNKRLQYIHPTFATKQQIWQLINKLKQTNLTNALVIFDSAKNFMVGGDRDKNRDVSKIMEVFKELRNNGATVILLHHTNRPQKDLSELVYAGSSAWEEDSSNAFILKQNNYKSTFLFQPIKNRVGELKDIAFSYNQDHTLTQVDFEEAAETEEDQQIRNEVIDFIANNPKCTYSQILQHVTSMGYGKDKVNKVIQAGKSKHWQAIKNKAKQNRDEYILIVTENISKKVEITDFVSDNKITSDKSYFRGIEERKESQIETDNYHGLLKVEQNMNIDIPTL